MHRVIKRVAGPQRPTRGRAAIARIKPGRLALPALAVVVALAVLGTGCTSSGERAANGDSSQSPSPAAPVTKSAFPVTVTDDASRTVEMKAEPQRIVSLAPANTEMLAALGLLDRLVGVTTYDDYPPSVKDLPKMGDFVNPNVEAIGAARPDLIVATTGVQADTLKKLEDLGAVVIAIDPTTIEGVYGDMETLGEATGTSDLAKERVNAMRSEIEAIHEAVASEASVKAFVEIGQNPLFTVGKGTLIDEMLTAAGGANVVEQPGYVAYSLEQLVKDDPAVYFATKGTMSDPSDLGKRAGYDKLAAVKAKRVFTLDDNYVTRPGPRIVLGIQQMAAAMHPDKVSR